MLIRPARAENLEAMAALHQLCFDAEAWGAARLEGSLSLPTTESGLLFDDDILIGFYLTQRTLEEIEILTFCVHPEHQGKGFGTKLLKHLIQQGAGHILFLEVAADNTAALVLYEGCGFRYLSRRLCYYQRENKSVDALIYHYASAC
ncbi:MAG: GNAT family N-acetyltransferase [Alphaproteobacteria bacterium]|nr:GNAT family N-acetyltransferase [Alphaproteobacteria bacterium]